MGVMKKNIELDNLLFDESREKDRCYVSVPFFIDDRANVKKEKYIFRKTELFRPSMLLQF